MSLSSNQVPVTFQDVLASIQKYGKDNIVVFQLEQNNDKAANKPKRKTTTVWIQLKFRKVDGKLVRFNLKTPVLYLPGGARSQSVESIELYGNYRIRVQMYQVERDTLRPEECFYAPEDMGAVDEAKFREMRDTIYQNNQTMLTILEALDASIRKQYTQFRGDSKLPKVRDTPPERVNSIRLDGFEDEDRKQDFSDNPRYRLTLQVDKDNGLVGYKGLETQHRFVPVVYDLTRSKSRVEFAEARVQDPETDEYQALTNTNIDRFVTRGSLAIAVLRLESLSIHPQGVSAHLFVTKLYVRPNLHQLPGAAGSDGFMPSDFSALVAPVQLDAKAASKTQDELVDAPLDLPSLGEVTAATDALSLETDPVKAMPGIRPPPLKTQLRDALF